MKNSNADEEDPRGSKHVHSKLEKVKVFKIDLQVSTMKNREIFQITVYSAIFRCSKLWLECVQ